MSEHRDNFELPRSPFLPLSAENEQINKSFLEGLASALRSDFVDIYEISEPECSVGYPKLPKERYLAKIIFMKLALDDIDSDSLTDSEPDYRVAIIADAYWLSAEDALAGTHKNEEDIQFGWPDTIGVSLLDITHTNLHNSYFTFQDNLGGFSHEINTRGFVHSERPMPEGAGVIDMAYLVSTSIYDGAYIDENKLTPSEQIRILATTLKKGRLDLEASERLRERSKTDPYHNYMSDNIDVVRGSIPYFKKLSESALEFTPDFREKAEQRQHFDETLAKRLQPPRFS